MSYVVLARKWRPMSFRDLIGQEHVSTILTNAIAQNRVAHAFLFTGVRGVGKTTSARILAKALNCLQPAASAERPGEPCLACASCKEIADGVDVDVREIDGASYTGVDEIRKLQETLPYRPVRDRYKIFIVDEVHMLSQNAWNALLKTLEEPPPHVKFIFATTEVHKVPVTILSRVQRFDFKMIPTRIIAARLRYVLDAEKIRADDRAVSLVAREAAGSMRDALSLLDQVIAFNPAELAGEEVARVLGLASYLRLLDLTEATLAGKPDVVLQIIFELANEGCDLTVAARDLLGIFRDLVVAKLCREPGALLDLSDAERSRIGEIAKAAGSDDLIRLQQGFAKAFDEISKAPDPRTALEMALVRASARPPLVPLDELVNRLLELESRLGTAKAAPPSGSGGPNKPGGGSGGGEPKFSRPPAPSPRPAAVPPSRAAPAPAEPSAKAPPPPAPAMARPPTPTSSTPERMAPAAASPPPERDSIADWRQVLGVLGETRPDLVAFLKHSVPLRVDGTAITLGYEAGNVLEASMRSGECVAALAAAAASVLGRDPKITFEAVAPGTQTLAATDKLAREQERARAVDRAEHHPSVKAATEILGAKVKRIELGES